MNVLHVTSDWKWTGPAEPMLRLALGLRQRGLTVDLACPGPPEPGMASLATWAEAEGLTPVLRLSGARGRNSDVRRLRDLLEERDVALVHAWHTQDHLLALRAAARRRRAGRTVVVRSSRQAEPLPAWPWNRWLFGRGCDGLVCVSPRSAERHRRLRGGRPVIGVYGAVDHERFFPRPADPAVRASLGLEAGHRVVGIVARAQRHRRFDLLLEAARRWFATDAEARLLVVGRGTHRAEVAEQPARELGIADRVIFAGYRGADFPDVLRAMDVFTFLVPGSDGSCRAVLEAAACGVPAVTTRRGVLPEIVADGETGVVVDEDPELLARAWGELVGDPDRRKRMGEAAHARARRLFTPERFADEVEGLYRQIRGGLDGWPTRLPSAGGAAL